jgi:hypothetical protein
MRASNRMMGPGSAAHHRCAALRPGHATAFPRREIRPGSDKYLTLDKEGAGNAGCLVHPQPRVRMKKAHERSHYRYAETIRHSLRDGFTVSFVLSPETWLFCLRRRRDAKHHRQLDTCLGVSGPHDFAVRIDIARLAISTRPSHPAPRFVTIGRNAPLSRDRMARTSIYDLPDEQSAIFFAGGLDDPNQIESPKENSVCAHVIASEFWPRRPGDIRKNCN